jgi:hypothetical protein
VRKSWILAVSLAVTFGGASMLSASEGEGRCTWDMNIGGLDCEDVGIPTCDNHVEAECHDTHWHVVSSACSGSVLTCTAEWQG